jgi:hypothetical protein
LFSKTLFIIFHLQTVKKSTDWQQYTEKQGAEPEIIPRATLAYSGEPEHSVIISGGSGLFFCTKAA